MWDKNGHVLMPACKNLERSQPPWSFINYVSALAVFDCSNLGVQASWVFITQFKSPRIKTDFNNLFHEFNIIKIRGIETYKHNWCCVTPAPHPKN